MRPEWETAIHLGSVEDLRTLAEAGADIDARDRHNQTSLMLAAAEGQTAVVEWLVGCGAQLDLVAKYGLSALMLAAVRGHSQIVRVLVEAGANVTLRGSGAPRFAGLAALDLAIARNNAEMIAVLEAAERRVGNPHFMTASSWEGARSLVDFVPTVPRVAGPAPALRVYVRDHKLHALPVRERTLEAHYGDFVFSQAQRTDQEARHLAVDVSYGPSPRKASIFGRPARVYELGPEPPPDDVDGRSPSVVAWHDGAMFYLLASHRKPVDALVNIAMSVYSQQS